MISIKSLREIELMKEAGRLTAKVLNYLKPFVKEGVTTKELNDLAYNYTLSLDSYPAFKDLYGFPGSICISVNEEVVHGIPGDRVIKNGDVVSLDFGATYKNYNGDSAITVMVGDVTPENENLVLHTEKALYEGLKEVKEGKRLGDVSHAIEKYALEHNLSVVKVLGGHGIGTHVHEDPFVPNFGSKGTGVILKENMTLAIEPILAAGTGNVKVMDDDWTHVTLDNKYAAHFEHTIRVTKDGYEILTEDKE